MGRLLDRYNAHLAEEAHQQAAEAEAALREAQTAESIRLQALANEQKALADRNANLLADLSPLLEVLDVRRKLGELKEIWGIGKIDADLKLGVDYSYNRPVSDYVMLGLSFSFWEAVGDKFETSGPGPSFWGHTTTVGYKAEKTTKSYSIQARNNPTNAFRIEAWEGTPPTHRGSITTDWTEFSPEDPEKAKMKLEITIARNIAQIPSPKDIIRASHEDVRRSVPMYKRPLLVTLGLQ